jgi:diguanylate cyclase (GGDEF)-like protein
MTVFVGYYWNRFFDAIFHLDVENNRSRKCLYLMPVITVAALLFINLFNGWLFSINEANVYSRGTYAFISFILQYLFFAILVIRAIAAMKSRRGARYFKLCASFISIGAITFVFIFMQVIAGGKIALQCFGIATGVFVMFLRFQDEQITNDILTGLNNRYALDAYCEDKIKLYNDGMWGRRRLYLIMMDINNFKRINDNYGHVEGDKALKMVATSLKAISNEYGDSLFVARYGGDEFCAVYESASEKKVIELCREIKETIMKESDGYKYRIIMGTGYSVYTSKAMSMATLYENADKALYDNKNSIKAGNDHT